jgi:formamidopyrimidine-DNA glycosylase
MPELPEVETTRRGISPYVKNQAIKHIKIRNGNLRWPVPRGLSSKLTGHKIKSVKRRAKYLLLGTDLGTVIIHLGMSGSLRIVPEGTRADKHDHVDILLGNKKMLRLRDPRRFGCVLFTDKPAEEHKLLKNLGPEPLSSVFDGDYLFKLSRKRKVAVKIFIMNSQIVVGVGNIYASEALFLAGILPRKHAGKLTHAECNKLASAIKRVLKAAIMAGGTSLRDFTRSDGNPGYFARSLKVYDRKGEPCRKCGNPIKQKVIGQRSTYYCTHCQH